MDPSQHKTLGEMVQYMNHIFEKKIRQYGFPQAINIMVKCKLDKVAKYVLSSNIDEDYLSK